MWRAMAAGLVLVMATGSAAMNAALAQKADSPSVAAFRVVHSVVTHPRCMNCHTTVGWPTQGDDQRRHTEHDCDKADPCDHGNESLAPPGQHVAFGNGPFEGREDQAEAPSDLLRPSRA